MFTSNEYVMITYFLFSAMVLCYFALISLAQRVSLKRPESLFFFLFLFFFTSFLTKHTLIETYPIHHLKVSSLFFPYHYTVGTFFFIWVRLEILPNASFSWKSGLILLPGVIEIVFILLITALSIFYPAWVPNAMKIYLLYLEPSLYWTSILILGTLLFVLKKKSIKTIAIVYQQQHRNIQIVLCFLILSLIAEFGTPEGDFFYTNLLLIGFSFFLAYKIMQNHFYGALEPEPGPGLLKAALNETNQAVVITDSGRLVRYANQAFVDITGYGLREVVGRKPSFLQGALTSEDQLKCMKNGLESLLPFETDIINYRKNGEAYVCHVAITPIFSDRKLTHFIAFEKDLQTIAAPGIDQKAHQLIVEIRQLFEKEKLYQNKHLQLGDVARLLNTSPRKISETIRNVENCSFITFVNQYRVDAAIFMLADATYANWTMDAIGEQVGFNSRSSFYAAFRSRTGKTPTIVLNNFAV